MDEQETLMNMFPHITASCNLTRYKGFISVGNTDFQICIHVPNYPYLSQLTLQCSWSASVLLAGYDSLLKEWVQNRTLTSFLENLRNLMELEMKRKSFICDHQEDFIIADSFKLLISDLSKIGFHNIVSLSPCLSKIQFQKVDDATRVHTIEVNVGKAYPLDIVQIQASLPDDALEIISKNSSVDKIYNSFVQQILYLQYTWNNLDLIDANCVVLDPEHPTRKDMGRRILIEKNVSIYLTMNFEAATAMPSITVLGPEQTVQHFQSRLTRNAELWNPVSTVIDNLREVLELSTFAVKENNDEISLVHGGECLICFTLWMDGEMPRLVCENSCCGSAFHNSCLFQWLQTVSGNYQSFNQIHGDCPNCNMPMSCPVPK